MPATICFPELPLLLSTTSSPSTIINASLVLYPVDIINLLVLICKKKRKQERYVDWIENGVGSKIKSKTEAVC